MNALDASIAATAVATVTVTGTMLLVISLLDLGTASIMQMYKP